jgi:hypothetical protein
MIPLQKKHHKGLPVNNSSYFQESKVHVHPKIEMLADSGYTGLHKHHLNSRVSQKSSKKKPLNARAKKTESAIIEPRFTESESYLNQK